MLSSRWVDPDIERDGPAQRRRARPRPLQRLVRPHRRPLQGADRLGARPPQDGARRWRRWPSSPASASSACCRSEFIRRSTTASSWSSSRPRPTPRSTRPAGRIERGARRARAGVARRSTHTYALDRRRRHRHGARRDGLREARRRRASAQRTPARARRGGRARGSSGSRASSSRSRTTPTTMAEKPLHGLDPRRGDPAAQGVRRGAQAGALRDPRHRRPRGDARARPARVPPRRRPRARRRRRPRHRRDRRARSARWSAARPSRPTRTRTGEAVDVRVRLPARPARRTSRQVGDLRLSVPGPTDAGAGAARRPGHASSATTSPSEINRRDLVAPGACSPPTSTTCRSAPRSRRRARGGGEDRAWPRATRSSFPARPRRMEESLRLHGRGAAPRGRLRLPDPRGAVRVVHRPAVDHAVAAALDRRHGRACWC